MPAGAQGLGSPPCGPCTVVCVLTACRLPSLEPVTQKTKADAAVSSVACVGVTCQQVPGLGFILWGAVRRHQEQEVSTPGTT